MLVPRTRLEELLFVCLLFVSTGHSRYFGSQRMQIQGGREGGEGGRWEGGVQCAVCSMQCVVCSVLCAVCSMQLTVLCVKCVVCCVQCKYVLSSL